MFTCVSVRAECTGAAQSVLVLFSFFADGDSVCVTMSRRNTARTPDYLTLHRALGWMVGEVGGQQKPDRLRCTRVWESLSSPYEWLVFTCVNVRAECTGAAQSVLVLFFPFSRTGTLCVTLCQGATLRAPHP